MRVGKAYQAILPTYRAKLSPAHNLHRHSRPLPAGTTNVTAIRASAIWPMPSARRLHDHEALDRLLHNVCTLRPAVAPSSQSADICCRCGEPLRTPGSVWRSFCCGTDYAECVRRQQVVLLPHREVFLPHREVFLPHREVFCSLEYQNLPTWRAMLTTNSPMRLTAIMILCTHGRQPHALTTTTATTATTTTTTTTTTSAAYRTPSKRANGEGFARAT